MKARTKHLLRDVCELRTPSVREEVVHIGQHEADKVPWGRDPLAPFRARGEAGRKLGHAPYQVDVLVPYGQDARLLVVAADLQEVCRPAAHPATQAECPPCWAPNDRPWLVPFRPRLDGEPDALLTEDIVYVEAQEQRAAGYLIVADHSRGSAAGGDHTACPGQDVAEGEVGAGVFRLGSYIIGLYPIQTYAALCNCYYM